jgi:hypothetical protein
LRLNKSNIKYYALIISWICFATGFAIAQNNQIDIPRIEAMPNQPSPYRYQDWKKAAMGFDELVYDFNKTGNYLPLLFKKESGVNYPAQGNFGLDTYVGTVNKEAGEAINVLPSLVGASLVGIDKSNQNGQNWVLASQDYFDKRNDNLIYLNNIGGRSGNDWWYDMMPNVYFYQLYDLYGEIGAAKAQFESIASQFEQAVRAMGGSDTPWQAASMNYRAWDFKANKPNTVGVPEPEAAGAFAWVLYHAYKKTGQSNYLKAAEWSMEFLTPLERNPSYELQLPYGAYIAAKMNAEIGTDYSIEKLINWTFDKGPLRNWGAIIGNWGGLDIAGLIGEVNANGKDYAFQLNGVQQAAALVPLVRYDKRFSRAIGKWMVNLTNSTRYFYPNALPSHLQDSKSWSEQYDTQGFIGYEALRTVQNGLSPFATGDAIKGGWAATNLSLYSSSSIGYLGSLIQATDEEKILQLDLLKTDFFREAAYPSYLIFNPYSTEKTIHIDVGKEAIDIYEVLSEQFLLKNVSGSVALTIPADEAISIVYTPVNGAISYKNKQLLIDDIIVDYQQSQQIISDFPPRIQSLATKESSVQLGDTISLYAKAIDKETSDLSYKWEASDGQLIGEGTQIKWAAPLREGAIQIKLIVEDEAANKDSAFLEILSTASINIAPSIQSIQPLNFYVAPHADLEIAVAVFDENGDSIQYDWQLEKGVIRVEKGNFIWTAPKEEGVCKIKLSISDNKGGKDEKEIAILVRDFRENVEKNLIAHYPFTGNAADISGNDLHGNVFGAKLSTDLKGDALAAYFFDGKNDHIAVENAPILNFEKGISVSFYFKPTIKPSKEAFLLSHGSWQNRWKISITPEQKIRWTLHNATGNITDLDSKIQIKKDSFYHVSANYDGQFITLYINGRLENFKAFTGKLKQSSVGLEIGQMLPDNAAYNFRGIIDEIQIFDRALIPTQVAAIAKGFTTSNTTASVEKEMKIALFPNPADQFLYLKSNKAIRSDSDIYLSIIGLDGKVYYANKMSFLGYKKLNISYLESGIYFLKIKTNKVNHYKKFIKK